MILLKKFEEQLADLFVVSVCLDFGLLQNEQLLDGDETEVVENFAVDFCDFFEGEEYIEEFVFSGLPDLLFLLEIYLIRTYIVCWTCSAAV